MPNWFKARSYKHFDRPVCEAFATKVMEPDFVSRHSFSPLIRYEKKEKRYKYCEQNKRREIKVKTRDIMYASHRDACILSYYSCELGNRLDQYYLGKGIDDNVIAYRSLGRGNYFFSAEAYDFAINCSPSVILAFDVTGFFDNLDHSLLKSRLKKVLGVNSLPEDWFKVFRFVTRYRFVELEDLKSRPQFAERLKAKGNNPIATVAELKADKIRFFSNPKGKIGIPQGTPISAVFSNLYMMDFDLELKRYCDRVGAFYRRYSDDILIICKPEEAAELEMHVNRLMNNERLQLSPAKTERTPFDVSVQTVSPGRAAQYLGFELGPNGATIRKSSLSRQWRKMRRAFKRTRRVAEAEIAAGRADKAFTKRLRRRFTSLQFRNFSSYGRRSAAAFGKHENIQRQIRRLERAAEKALQDLSRLHKA